MSDILLRQRIVDEARTWLGTPYHHRGRVKGAGVDCAMLLCEVYYEVGALPYIDPGYYPADWHLHRSDEKYLGWLKRYGREVAEPQVGDVVLWQFGRCYSHGAIYIGGGDIIHSYLSIGCSVGSLNDAVFEGRNVRYFEVAHGR